MQVPDIAADPTLRVEQTSGFPSTAVREENRGALRTRLILETQQRDGEARLNSVILANAGIHPVLCASLLRGDALKKSFGAVKKMGPRLREDDGVLPDSTALSQG